MVCSPSFICSSPSKLSSSKKFNLLLLRGLLISLFNKFFPDLFQFLLLLKLFCWILKFSSVIFPPKSTISFSISRSLSLSISLSWTLFSSSPSSSSSSSFKILSSFFFFFEKFFFFFLVFFFEISNFFFFLIVF